MKMYVDALAENTARHLEFPTELLVGIDDAELNALVERAADELDMPIALVTLVLERIQFFRSHTGLPDDLAASRATERDVSFCQFVVRDGSPFEVINAAEDPRIPQALVRRYGISAYLGIPVRVGQTVVGSLCVLDTKPRGFTDAERERLTELAEQVSRQLNSISKRVRSRPPPRPATALGSGLASMEASLAPVEACSSIARMAATTLSSLVELVAHTEAGGAAPPGVLKRTIQESRLALEDLEDALVELEVSRMDVVDDLVALKSLLPTVDGESNLSAVLQSVQDLTRSSFAYGGSLMLPHLDVDVRLAAAESVLVECLASALNKVLVHVRHQGGSLDSQVIVEDATSALIISIAYEGLSEESMQSVQEDLESAFKGHPLRPLLTDSGRLQLTVPLVLKESD